MAGGGRWTLFFGMLGGELYKIALIMFGGGLVAELAYALASGASGETLAGSNPAQSTNKQFP